MIRQFRDGGKPKKRLHEEVTRPKTGSEESDPAIDTLAEDIDPAEFFDPEEFGFRRNAKQFPG